MTRMVALTLLLGLAAPVAAREFVFGPEVLGLTAEQVEAFQASDPRCP